MWTARDNTPYASTINGEFVSYGLILGLPTWKLLITIETRGTVMAKLKNVHPGEVLLEEFLVPMKLSQNALARAIGVPPRRINEIVLGKRSITADTALRLAKTFGTSEGFWLGLQEDYDVEEARKLIAKDLAHVERITFESLPVLLKNLT